MKAAFFVLLGFVSLESFGSATPITSCGVTINQPGEYRLMNNLVCPFQSTAITVLQTRNVRLDLKGHSILFAGFPKVAPPLLLKFRRGTGILVRGSKDVKIDGQSAARINMGLYGVRVSQSEDVKMDELVLSSNRYGVAYEGSVSEDGRIEDASFLNNTCDIRVAQGAEAPDVDDSTPDQPVLCN